MRLRKLRGIIIIKDSYMSCSSKKTAQGSIEFMLIFIFVFVLFFLFVSFVLSQVSDYEKRKNELDIDSFANSIISEYQMMQNVEDGYSRKVEISDLLLSRFNITLSGNYLLIQNIELGVSDDIFHYVFSGVGNVSFLYEDRDGNGFNETYLFFRRD